MDSYPAEKIIETGRNPGRKGSFYYDELFTDGKGIVCAGTICLAGVFSRLMAGSFYKGLIKESTNLALTKNKYLRNLKQSAEDTYRINQGMNNTRVYLERQIYGLRMLGLSVRGLDNLSGQLTLLCFLAGGGAAFLSYWYRSDNYYIVLYGTVGILAGDVYHAGGLRGESGGKAHAAVDLPSGLYGKCDVAAA